MDYEHFYISKCLIRRAMFEGEWWYCVTDVIFYLTKSKDSMRYIQLRRYRNEEFKKEMDLNMKRLLIKTTKGKRYANCCNLCGLKSIIRNLPKKYYLRYWKLIKRVK